MSLRRRVVSDAHAAGMPVPTLSGTLGLEDRGDGHLVGEVGPMVLRFVRERGQDWVEVGSVGTEPPVFYSFHDVEVAFGWRTVEEVLGIKDVEPLADVFQRIVQHREELQAELAGPRSAGWARVALVAKNRGEAFTARLR